MDLSDVATVDFETTNIDPKLCEPVEVAIFARGSLLLKTLILPEKMIPVETSAVHHITNSDVANAPSWGRVLTWMRDLLQHNSIKVLAAHNAKYEQDVIGKLLDDCKVQWICTYKCALRLWPDAPNYKNETLRYWLELPELGREFPQHPHSADHDAIVTYQILERMAEVCTIEQMIEWSAEPALLPRIPFGKHRGMSWKEVPYDYLAWILKQMDMDADVKFCAQNEVARRRTGATVRSG